MRVILFCMALFLASCGGSSSQSPKTVSAPSLAGPSSLGATSASSTEIDLTWTASADARVTGYLIERCQGAGCANFSQIAAPAATTFNDTGLTPATSYSYRVRATDSAGDLSDYSAVATASTAANTAPPTAPPTAPANLTATAVSIVQISLSWGSSTDNVGVTGYLVERCQGAGCANFAQIATPAVTSFNDTGLTPATSYSYRVRATDAAGNLSSYSGVAGAATPADNITVSLTPARGGLTISQTLNLSATTANDVGTAGVTWSTTLGSFGAQSPTSATYVAPGTPGTVTVTATSVTDATKSASATFGVTDLGLVGTYHNDNSRDGANTQEFALTTANVNTTTFGKLFSCAVDGAIYAQPLWVANLTINGAKHNVVIVATQHDSVYAFDADASPCLLLWQAALLDATHGGTVGETTVPSGTANSLVGSGDGDIKPEVGVTGTPVIDPVANTVYVVSKSAVANALPIFQRLHALNLLDGTERAASPVNIDASISVAGTADGSSTINFNPQQENQRAGLALVNGIVYVAWASHEDADPFHGWMMGFNGSMMSIVPNGVFATTPNQVGSVSYSRGGIWMSGGAPAADANGNLYFSTGNGTFDADSGGSNFGDTTLKLATASGLSVADWFTPADQSALDVADSDHGSGGAAILLNAPTGNYLIAGGKEGSVFLLSEASLGHYGANSNPLNSNARQEFNVGSAIFSTAAFWNNSLYIAPVSQALQVYNFDTTAGMFNTGAASISSHLFGWPGTSPSISASGTTGGIIWAMDNSPYCTQQSSGCGAAVLYALDANNASNELWDSSTVVADQAGNAIKFVVPTVANGKVYLGTRGNDTGNGTSSVVGELDVYGLKPN
ncbi:MAG TPA: fibronectin type III domain-containing protein [Steroidobacteraceae bacterium]